MRVLTSVVLIPTVTWLILFAPQPVFQAAVSVFALLCWHEFAGLAGYYNARLVSWHGWIPGLLILYAGLSGTMLMTVIILGALDVALWDLYGQMLEQPVWQLLGGVQRGPFQSSAETSTTHVTPYCTLVSDQWGGEAMFTQQIMRAETLAGLGYRAFKIEPMMSTPADVVELARRFRRALGSRPTLMVDVGYLFHDVPTAERVVQQLAEFDVYFFETPFAVDSPVPWAQLAARSPIPLAMGEHGVTRWEFLVMV